MNEMVMDILGGFYCKYKIIAPHAVCNGTDLLALNKKRKFLTKKEG